MRLKQIARKVTPPAAMTVYKTLRYRWLFGDAPYSEVFGAIYRNNLWGDAESVSGSGSRLDVSAMFREELSRWLASQRIGSLADVPCGDFNWMRHVAFPDGMQYLGMDIVPELIAKNNERYAKSNSHIHFEAGDILTSDLPSVEAFLCKDVFIHFPNIEIAKAIQRVRATQCRFILATTFPNMTENKNIRFGEVRRVNMSLPEFGLGEPDRMLKDFFGNVTDRYIGVWRNQQHTSN